MAETQNIQNACTDAMKNLARENDKFGCLLETLKGKDKLHLEGRDLDGLLYQLEDLHAAIDCVLLGQMQLAVSCAVDTAKAAEEAQATEKPTGNEARAIERAMAVAEAISEAKAAAKPTTRYEDIPLGGNDR